MHVDSCSPAAATISMDVSNMSMQAQQMRVSCSQDAVQKALVVGQGRWGQLIDIYSERYSKGIYSKYDMARDKYDIYEILRVNLI